MNIPTMTTNWRERVCPLSGQKRKKLVITGGAKRNQWTNKLTPSFILFIHLLYYVTQLFKLSYFVTQLDKFSLYAREVLLVHWQVGRFIGRFIGRLIVELKEVFVDQLYCCFYFVFSVVHSSKKQTREKKKKKMGCVGKFWEMKIGMKLTHSFRIYLLYIFEYYGFNFHFNRHSKYL